MKHLFSFSSRSTFALAALLGTGSLLVGPLSTVRAQGVRIGTPGVPDPKAALDLSASDRGLLIPRLDSSQRVALGTPPDGLMVFQKNGRVGLWYAFGGTWFFIPDKVKAGDNLGSHVANRNLNLNGHLLTGGGSSGLYLAPDGRAGLGTTSPAQLLQVGSAGNPVPAFVRLGAGNGAAQREWELGVKVNPGNLSDVTGENYDFAIRDATGNATRLLIDYTAGNVGVNTPSPTARLDVNGGARVRDLGNGGANPRLLTVDGNGNLAAATALPPGTTGDNLGNHSATQSLTLNTANDLLLRDAADANHGLGYYGPSKTWNGALVDGPVLYGFGGGVLGTNQNGTRATALTWNGSGNVGISGSATIGTTLSTAGSAGIGVAPGLHRLSVGTTDYRAASFTSSNTSGTYLNLVNTSTGGSGFQFISTGAASSTGGGTLLIAQGTGGGLNLGGIVALSGSSGNLGIGTSSPQQKLDVEGHARVTQAVLARALVTADYETASGPDVFAGNTDHIVDCPAGYAVTTVAVYATDHLDGRMRVNCANLADVMGTGGFWTAVTGGATGLHSAHCPTGQVATGWAMHAGSYLDGNLQLHCRPLLAGFTRGNEFLSVQLQSSAVIAPSTGLKHQYQGGTCPPGTFLTGVEIQRSNTAMENLNEVYCAGIRAD